MCEGETLVEMKVSDGSHNLKFSSCYSVPFVINLKQTSVMSSSSSGVRERYLLPKEASGEASHNLNPLSLFSSCLEFRLWMIIALPYTTALRGM